MKLKVVFRDKFLACHVYTWYECEVYEHDDEHNAVSNLTYYVTEMIKVFSIWTESIMVAFS